MSEHRFFVPPESSRADRFPLTAADARHARRILRLRPGDPLTVLDGAGSEIQCSLHSIEGDRVWVAALGRRMQPQPHGSITLVQSMLKGKAMDWVIQKATELGIRRLVPFRAHRSVAVLEGEAVEGKLAGWRQTSIEAAKQCGTAWLPEMVPPAGMDELPELLGSCDVLMVASLGMDTTHPSDALSKPGIRSVAIAIGPEGDFTQTELAGLQAMGARFVTLGPLVLRAETAALASIAVVQYELGRSRPA